MDCRSDLRRSSEITRWFKVGFCIVVLSPKTEASIAPLSFSASKQVYKRMLRNRQENSTKVHGNFDGLAEYSYMVASDVAESGTNHHPWWANWIFQFARINEDLTFFLALIPYILMDNLPGIKLIPRLPKAKLSFCANKHYRNKEGVGCVNSVIATR